MDKDPWLEDHGQLLRRYARALTETANGHPLLMFIDGVLKHDPNRWVAAGKRARLPPRRFPSRAHPHHYPPAQQQHQTHGNDHACG